MKNINELVNYLLDDNDSEEERKIIIKKLNNEYNQINKKTIIMLRPWDC